MQKCSNCGLDRDEFVPHHPVNTQKQFMSVCTHNIYNFNVLCDIPGSMVVRRASGEIGIVERNWLYEVR